MLRSGLNYGFALPIEHNREADGFCPDERCDGRLMHELLPPPHTHTL